MVSADDFVSIEYLDNPPWARINIKYGALGMSVIGGVLLAWFEGFIAIPLGIVQAVTMAFEELAARYTLLVRTVVGADEAFTIAWAQANAEVLGSGLAAFTVSVVVVGAVWWLYSWGVTRLG